jgi:hypothetical protein
LSCVSSAFVFCFAQLFARYLRPAPIASRRHDPTDAVKCNQ